MPVVVAMLRGVNLGPYNRLKMEELRALCTSLGLQDVQTYIQSGNVVCRAPAKSIASLAKRIEKAIEETFGFRAAVVIRTTAELREVIARNPFAARPEVEPNRLLVHFLAARPAAEACAAVLQIDTAPEELVLDGSELFIYFPNGMARPKMPFPAIERKLLVTGTGRNWNTVKKLLDMAEALER